MELQQFQQHILKGIPSVLPQPKTYESTINHAPKRKDILNWEEKKLAIQNALRYFEPQHHAVLAKEFAEELKNSSILFYNMVIRPFQEELLDAFDSILAFNGVALKLFFKTLQPLEFTDLENTQNEEQVAEETGTELSAHTNPLIDLGSFKIRVLSETISSK